MIVSDQKAADTWVPSSDSLQRVEFKKIYLLYWQRIFSLAYYRLRSTYLAENIVQDVFTSLWMRQYNNNNLPIRDVYAWLAAASRYAIMKQLTIEQKRKTAALNNESLLSTPNDVDFIFIEKILRTEINRLPKKCKLVFRYSRENNLPNKVIAKQLNLSEKAVEKHITTAIRKLRFRLKDFF
jgi:RNA polymerase sigma factor (sigma-70 family)